jgi:hypothetical protein
MFRLCKLAIAAAVLTPLAATAAVAGAAICPDGACVVVGPGHYPTRLHDFRPRLRDGLPMLDSVHTDPTELHGVGCIWTRRPVPTPSGPAWGIGEDCWRY